VLIVILQSSLFWYKCDFLNVFQFIAFIVTATVIYNVPLILHCMRLDHGDLGSLQLGKYGAYNSNIFHSSNFHVSDIDETFRFVRKAYWVQSLGVTM
jgi:hypothetical protein